MRVIGIDLGSKRIGIALSDSDLTVATPLALYHVDAYPRVRTERRSSTVVLNTTRAAGWMIRTQALAVL